MVKFLIYLIESGLCISVLFLVYLFLLKKETYFRFNRIYLISIVVISSVLPLLHFNINLDNDSNYQSYFNKIDRIKTSYTQVFEVEDIQETGVVNLVAEKSTNNPEQFKAGSTPIKHTSKANNYKWSYFHLILLIYIIGISFLIIRSGVLFRWVYKTFLVSKKERFSNYTIVDVPKDIAPFSFFKFIFLSKENIDPNQLQQIIEHEKIHISQNHSVDLLLVQLLCIMHWYNPIVWIMLKAVKTNHEFIADSEVISEGYNVLDYQELLLNQFISFPTIKVVNNLNLTSIKDRIKMMNKFKSGYFAKIKAILIIPVALFVFLIFSNLTIQKSNSISLVSDDLPKSRGMWTNESDNTFGKYILFENLKFSILENYHILREYPYEISDNKIILDLPKNEKAILKYELNKDKLKVWWGNSESSVFKKSNYDNTLDDFIAQYGVKLNLPTISDYKILQRPELCIDIIIANNKYIINGTITDIDNLKSVLIHEKENMNTLYKQMITVNIYNDTNTPMNMVADLKQTLRETNLLKICYMGVAEDNKVSKLETRFVGIPRKLPPLMGTNEAEVLEMVPDSVNVN